MRGMRGKSLVPKNNFDAGQLLELSGERLGIRRGAPFLTTQRQRQSYYNDPRIVFADKVDYPLNNLRRMIERRDAARDNLQRVADGNTDTARSIIDA